MNIKMLPEIIAKALTDSPEFIAFISPSTKGASKPRRKTKAEIKKEMELLIARKALKVNNR